jgi:prophage regulatory protein
MERILRIKDVIETTGLSRSSIYELQNREQFPRSVKLCRGAVGWLASEIQGWIAERAETSRGGF